MEHLDSQAVRERFEPLAIDASGYLGAAGLESDGLEIRYAVAMRYIGQGHEIDIQIPDPFHVDVIARMRTAYERRYAEIFGVAFTNQALECVEWKVEAIARHGRAGRLRFATTVAAEHQPRTRSRRAYFSDGGWVEQCTVYDLLALRAGSVVVGPALIEEHESTAVLGPGDRAVVDPSGNLLVDIHFE